MVTNDATILHVKHEVLYEVAKLAWAGELEEKRDYLPYKMIPGPQAQFRCCIYKEREIIRETWSRSSARPARSVPSPPTP